MLAFVNATAVLEDGLLENATVLIDGEKISAVGKEGEVNIPKDAEIIDLDGKYIGPGFVDIHVHGGGKYFFYENPELAADFFLSHGETTVLPTLYYDLSREELVESVKRIKTAIMSGRADSIGGIYMEGPYMNPKYGASPEKNKWRGEIKRENYEELVREAGEYAKVWVIAPEREGVEDFVKFVKEINPEAVISVGHSEATPEQVERFKKYGLILQTHSMNATGRPESSLGTRSCGPDEACMLDKDMYAEMISDSQAIHVHPDMQRLLLSVKGIDKIVLISDSFVSNEKPHPDFAHVTDLSFDANGSLCGSKLTLDVVIKNVIKHTGVTLAEAFRMTSYNPAKVIGMDSEIGTVEAGKTANLVVLDKDLNLEKVILKGKTYKGEKQC